MATTITIVHNKADLATAIGAATAANVLVTESVTGGKTQYTCIVFS